MAEYSNRRVVDGLDVQRRGLHFVSRDCNKINNQDIQMCDRIGCSGRLSSARSTRKAKMPSSSKCSLSGKKLDVNPANKGAKGSNLGSSSEGETVRHNRTFLKKPASNLTSLRISVESKSSPPQLSRHNISTTRPSSRYLRCGSVPENTRSPTSRNGISISEVRPAPRSQISPSALVKACRSDTSTSRHPPQMYLCESARDQRMPHSLSATSGPHRARICTRTKMTERSHSRSLTSSSEIAGSTSLIDHEGFRHYNINGIAEVLLALDQIEHDQEISIEQLMSLESNQFLNSLSFPDQHWEMRLDIDSMSYEELLALEESIGSVSTALSEEALTKSINKCTYNSKPLAVSFSNNNEMENDTKCSICQEEYDTGDEMGSLKCKHSYHSNCIDQWLRLKNWCPICKSSAASSSS